MAADDFTEPTTAYWQRIVDATSVDLEPPWRHGYPARLPDGRVLVLPIRRLPGDPPRAVASLIANQASFEVVRTLAAYMAERARPLGADVVLGLPTLGFAFAPLVAEALGHARFVPLGYSRKFWYDETLSAPVHSLTTPTAGKRVYLDPNQRSLVAGRRIVIVDDAVSSGSTLRAVIPMVESLGATVAGVVVAMLQGDDWRAALGADASLVRGVFASPRLRLVEGGWVAAG